MIDKKRIYENMKRLVEVSTVSGTPDEAPGADKLIELLYEISYFSEHKDAVEKVSLIGDLLDRSIVCAYLNIHPENKDVVILSGHYDVVDVEEYGHLQGIAYDVEAVSKRINEMPIDADTEKDFNSGEWIFGRGTADMKYGHALYLELLRYYSENPDTIKGNLLYVAVCGEETNSEGMLRAVAYFNEFRKTHNLHYDAFLLTECYDMEDQANNTTHYIHYGSSGKIMPMFFFVGDAAHGDEPFLGLDPTLISTKLYQQVQFNTTFCQTALGSTTPPPVCLKLENLKKTYSVSTPLYAISYYNLVILNLDPEQLTNKLKSLAYDSMKWALDFMDKKKKEYDIIKNSDTVMYRYEPCVKTYKEILDEVRKTYDGDLDAHMKQYAQDLTKEGICLQDAAVSIVKHAYELYKDKRPMVILSYIPPYYPDNYIPKDNPDAARLMSCCDRVIKYAKEQYDEPLEMKDWYMGVSDMCYTALQADKNFDSLFENLVGINTLYQFPEKDLKEFSVPAVVLGAYGKDVHKHTERLHKHYNFDVLPDLYVHLINDILK